jgi:signal transduction histidine kinase/CheY-like chemotaxis protein
MGFTASVHVVTSLDFSQLDKGFMPHGYCLAWDPPLLFVFIAGNIGIAIAYFLIPAALRKFVGKRKDLPYPHMFMLFAAFIMSCGVTHLLKVWTLWHPQYWLEASADLWTAGVSLVTAALLYPLIPQALALRSPKELQEANSKLNAEIEANRTTQQQLLLARDQAIEASSLKSAFIANVSHELRTPLAGILGMNELLLSHNLNEEQKMLAQGVQDSGRSLLRLVNDLLDLSKIEAGKLNLESIKLSPVDLIHEAVAIVEPMITEKGLTLKIDLSDDLPGMLFGDPVRTNQVLLNLLGNSAKFTSKGTIRLGASVARTDADYSWIRFEVDDTGIGIGSDETRFLFQPFSQVDNSTTRRFQGTGLGLSICKRLVDLMGGEIGFKSEKGHGSSFWFEIPFKLRSSAVRVEPSTPGYSAATAPVLVIEDHPTVQVLVKRQFQLLEIACTIVGTAEQGLEELRTHEYGLILMDCNLPGMDGFEATRQIRRSELDTSKRIPIIAMTAGALKGDEEKCLGAGMDDYLAKPYTFDQLREKIARWMPLGDAEQASA